MKYTVEIEAGKMVKRFFDSEGNEFKETQVVKGPGVSGTIGQPLDVQMEIAGIDDDSLLEAIYDGDLHDIWKAIRNRG